MARPSWADLVQWNEASVVNETGLVERLREIVASTAELDLAEVTEDASFYDELMVDSLQKLEIVVQIERAFGVKLTDREAAGLQRVRDAVMILKDKGALESHA